MQIQAWRPGETMAGNTVTFALGGRVDIDKLAEGVNALQRLIGALTGSDKVTWVVDDLQSGSAVATLRGECDNPAIAERIVNDYADIGGRLQRRERLNYGRRVDHAADAIKSLAQTVDFVRFETPNDDYTIYGNGQAKNRTLSKSMGAITGRIQTLSNRGGLRFNLYDVVHDRAVGCYLRQGQEALMREAWGRRARVSGSITREQPTGRPLTIREILDVEILEDSPPGSYQLAKGAVPWSSGDKMPEEIIRQLRDA